MNVSVSGAGGTVSPATRKINYNANATLNTSAAGAPDFLITPATGYSIASITVNGGASIVAAGATSATIANVQALQNVVITFALDVQKPVISSSSPAKAPAATNVALNAPITVNFSETIKVSTVSAASFQVKDHLGNSVPGSFSPAADSMSFTFTPTANYLNNKAYTVTLTNAITDLAGNALDTSNALNSFGFTTVSSSNNVTLNVGANGAVTIYDLLGDTNNQITKLSLAGVTTTNSLNGTLKWQLTNDGTNIVFSLIHPAGSSIMAQGSKNVAIQGNTITLSPKNNSGISGSVTYSGNAVTDMDAANTVDVVTVPENSVNIQIPVANNTSRSISIEPAIGSQLSQYSFDAVPSLDDMVANGLVKTYTFTKNVAIAVSFSNDITPPAVVKKTPDNLAVNVPLSPTIDVVFSEAIDQASIDEATQAGFILKELDSSGKEITNIMWKVVKSVNSMQFTTVGSLLPNKTYKATVTTAIKDLATPPNKLAVPVSWTFDTMLSPHAITLNAGANGTVSSLPVNLSSIPEGTDVVFTIKPDSATHPWYQLDTIKLDNITKPSPARNADGSYTYTVTNVLVDHTVDVAFSKVQRTVTAAPVANGAITSTLTPLDAAGKVTVGDNDNVVLTIRPNAGYVLSGLADGSAINFNAVPLPAGLSKTDNADGTTTWSYSISNLIADHNVLVSFSGDTTKPTVISTTPVDVASGVDTATALVVAFNKTVNPASFDQINQTGFTLKNLTDNSTVNWTVVNNSDRTIFTFTPATPLLLGKQYQATVSAAKVVDVAPVPNKLVTDKTWTFTTRPASHSITLTVGANGGVTSVPAAVNNVVTVIDATDIVLTITPVASGVHPWYQLAAISVDGSPVALLPALNGNGSSTYTIANVTKDMAVSLSFEKIPHVVSITQPVTNGKALFTSVLTNVTTVLDGDAIAVKLTPDAGYYLADLKVNGVSKITQIDAATSTFTISSVIETANIQPVFSKYPYLITVVPPTAGTGAVTPDSFYAKPNDVATFTLTPANGYELTALTYDGQNVFNPTQRAIYTTAPITKSAELVATYSLITHKLTANAPANGTVVINTAKNNAGNYVYDKGTASFTLTANKGYVLDTLTFNTIKLPVLPTGTKNLDGTTTYTFTQGGITTDSDLIVTFAPRFTITASAGANGTISPSGDTTVIQGSSQSYTFTPNNGYQVDNVLLDGAAVAVTANSYTVAAIAANHTLNVTFKLQTYKVTATLAAGASGGSITPATSDVTAGGSVELTITPPTGNTVGSVTLNATPVDPKNIIKMVSGSFKYTLASITSDKAVTVSFTPIVYKVDIVKSTGGVITASPTNTGEYNSSLKFSITPDAHYSLKDLKLDGVSVLKDVANSSYTLSNISADHILSAEFIIDSFTISASVGTGGGGGITPSGDTTLNYGASQAYQVTPLAGFAVKDVTVDNVSVLAKVVNNVYIFDTVSAKHSIVATFAAAGTTTYPDGDLNGDGKVDIADALLALKMAVKLIAVSAADLKHGDVAPLNSSNKPVPDNKIDIDDAVVLLQRAVGNLPTW